MLNRWKRSIKLWPVPYKCRHVCGIDSSAARFNVAHKRAAEWNQSRPFISPADAAALSRGTAGNNLKQRLCMIWEELAKLICFKCVRPSCIGATQQQFISKVRNYYHRHRIYFIWLPSPEGPQSSFKNSFWLVVISFQHCNKWPLKTLWSVFDCN